MVTIYAKKAKVPFGFLKGTITVHADIISFKSEEEWEAEKVTPFYAAS